MKVILNYALKNGKIISCDKNHTIYESGTILIENGKIKSIISSDEEIPADFEIFDATNRVITPGFIDSHTHQGVFDGSVGRMG